MSNTKPFRPTKEDVQRIRDYQASGSYGPRVRDLFPHVTDYSFTNIWDGYTAVNVIGRRGSVKPV